MDKDELYIGVMSGTSMDGVDTAIVRIREAKAELLFHDFYPLDETLKQELLTVCLGQETTLRQVGRLDHHLGHLFADAVIGLLNKSPYKAEDIVAIGNHGQTVFHQPYGSEAFTMQLGDANIIAAKTGITTVADFRRKDMALGGQGAPLVPAFHHSVFEPSDSTIVVLNIGGISNISVMIPGEPTLGYDTGPGNMLMDAWINKVQGKKYDDSGNFARSGKVNASLLSSLCSDDYFSLTPPKSTGREKFNLPWLINHLDTFGSEPDAADVQATLTEFTVRTICDEVEKFKQGPNPELMVCGGGASNRFLMDKLKQQLPDWQVCTTTDKGVDSDYMEAIAFAWLAQRRIHNLPSNLPEVTGAEKAASLGVIYPAD
ncbi:anhydro-N-acetylmuramic acid kinase [Vibrio sp. JC009]|uniref:anhydro-N-acetylmuramic acid kinase n=1 Tax=Vibrio sp. JC009 TaxID=2912314 RepID=UPI0023B1A893|nr:anhydro-N-acetylmuramic acid kinase [Vibrio sp. JC009]WED22411.1 anhydro-N-acetylmuramic acid kinase [Vibrio sp. JC009]